MRHGCKVEGQAVRQPGPPVDWGRICTRRLNIVASSREAADPFKKTACVRGVGGGRAGAGGGGAINGRAAAAKRTSDPLLTRVSLRRAGVNGIGKRQYCGSECARGRLPRAAVSDSGGWGGANVIERAGRTCLGGPNGALFC